MPLLVGAGLYLAFRLAAEAGYDTAAVWLLCALTVWASLVGAGLRA